MVTMALYSNRVITSFAWTVPGKLGFPHMSSVFTCSGRYYVSRTRTLECAFTTPELSFKSVINDATD